MEFLSRKMRSVAPYTAGEQPQDRAYVKLNTNENPYPPSPAASAVLRAFDSADLKRYPRPDADGLRAAIAAAEGVKAENVFCGNGSDEVLALCFPAFFDADGAGACFADISYSFYPVFASFFGIPAVIVPVKEDFSYDMQGFAAANCQGYFLANPNAPTSLGVGREEVERLLKSHPDRLLIADEAYMAFFGASCVPLTAQYENLLVVKTFSKSYSLAGIRCGYAVGHARLIEGLLRAKDCYNSYPLDSVCQAVCAAAVSDGAYYAAVTERVISERERVRSALLALGFRVPESKANFLFAGYPETGGRYIYEQLKKRGVLVRHWEKERISDYCRITVGTPEENDKLLSALQDILR